jgi:cold shock CspA family protein
MYQGTITFVSEKGWFFAKSDSDNSAVFIHQRDVHLRRYLRVDDRVEFDLTPSTKHNGEFQATKVRYIGRLIARQVSSNMEVSGE